MDRTFMIFQKKKNKFEILKINKNYLNEKNHQIKISLR